MYDNAQSQAGVGNEALSATFVSWSCAEGQHKSTIAKSSLQLYVCVVPRLLTSLQWWRTILLLYLCLKFDKSDINLRTYDKKCILKYNSGLMITFWVFLVCPCSLVMTVKSVHFEPVMIHTFYFIYV